MAAPKTAGHRPMGLAFLAGLLVGCLAIWPAVGRTLAAVNIGSQSLGPTGRMLLVAVGLLMFSAIGVVVVYYLL
jgi:hypothetical protein